MKEDDDVWNTNAWAMSATVAKMVTASVTLIAVAVMVKLLPHFLIMTMIIIVVIFKIFVSRI